MTAHVARAITKRDGTIDRFNGSRSNARGLCVTPSRAREDSSRQQKSDDPPGSSAFEF
jgi:hypothetical protein